MYVRWKRQKRSKKEYEYYFLADSGNTHPQGTEKEAYLLTAYLVENVRVCGKPKQKILSYLGSINSTKLTNPGANEKFWKSVDTHLRSLQLKSDQRKDIEQLLQKRIPKVSERVLYNMVSLERRHPRNRSHKEKEQLEEFRSTYNLPGDDMRSSVVPTT